MKTIKATIVVDVGDKAEKKIAAEWLLQNQKKLTYSSGNNGCGCCIDSYSIEGPPELIASIPKCILADDPAWENSAPGQSYEEAIEKKFKKQQIFNENNKRSEELQGASEAFRVKNFPLAIALFTKNENTLGPIEKSKLSYARRNVKKYIKPV